MGRAQRIPYIAEQLESQGLQKAEHLWAQGPQPGPAPLPGNRNFHPEPARAQAGMKGRPWNERVGPSPVGKLPMSPR